ncbi:MAG TPA: hypothetical protein VHL53_14380 [Acidimicrobiia bacterium]|nr:hypothetical protein [Acidimicrobiia bacterium]
MDEEADITEVAPAEEEPSEVDEALMAEGGKLLEEAVGQLSAGDLDTILRALPSPVSTELVKDLIGNKLDPKRLKNLSSLLIGPLRKRPAARLSFPIEHLSLGILDTFQHELGEERFENPSADDLREVLDAVLAKHPTAGVRCTLAWVTAEGMRAAAAAKEVLVGDERLRLPAWSDAPAS